MFSSSELYVSTLLLLWWAEGELKGGAWDPVCFNPSLHLTTPHWNPNDVGDSCGALISFYGPYLFSLISTVFLHRHELDLLTSRQDLLLITHFWSFHGTKMGKTSNIFQLCPVHVTFAQLINYRSWRPPKSYVAAVQNSWAHWEISQYAGLSGQHLGLLYCIQFSERLLHIDAHQPPDLHQLYWQLQEQCNVLFIWTQTGRCIQNFCFNCLCKVKNNLRNIHQTSLGDIGAYVLTFPV